MWKYDKYHSTIYLHTYKPIKIKDMKTKTMLLIALLCGLNSIISAQQFAIDKKAKYSKYVTALLNTNLK
jgi:hypothetical protein